MGLSQERITQIINNTNFGEINNLLTQGHDMDYIARHYNMDLSLAWALTGWREKRTRKSSKSSAGVFGHGINGISTNVYPVKFMLMTAKRISLGR